MARAPGAPSPSPATPLSRTARRKAEARRRLLDAGRIVIGERGVAGLRITDVTERADVALGSFYNHFESKEALVDEIVRDSLGEILSSILERTPLDGDPAPIVAASTRRFVGLALEQPDFARLVVSLDHADSVFMDAIEPAARDAIGQGVESGRFSVVDLDTAVITLAAGAVALIRAIVEGRHDVTDAPRLYTEQVLLTLGVDADEAAALAAAPMPAAPG
ncbi:MAG: TetR/AcrR family transcriptional regulator [Solirubrobacteraceae bacterium]|nr:TetR/AcrR family transcriptional regulator [Solirubrobacteraceae bacterium]